MGAEHEHLRTSIFQAEIYAINRCAQYIHDRGATHRRIAIISDIQAAHVVFVGSMAKLYSHPHQLLGSFIP